MTILPTRPVAALLEDAAAILRAAGIDSPRLEARLLLAHLLGCAPSVLPGRMADRVASDGLPALVARRAAHEPLALIVGHQEFWSLEFAVSPATLIPRADSESLIEAALAARPDREAVRRVLDLGTGTGCLLLAALSEFRQAWGLGVDVVEQAAVLAARNAAALGLAARAGFIRGDWAQAVRGRFDLVLANPPYVRAGEIAGLMPEVAGHEPRSALDGGADGLAAYRVILTQLPALLAPAGVAVLEIGQDQQAAVPDLARASGFTVTDVRPDLAGVPRAVVLCVGS